MFAAIDLDQLAIRLAAETWLMERLPLLARGPEASLKHPRPHGLPAHLDAVPLIQGFDGQRRSEVSVLSSDQLE